MRVRRCLCVVTLVSKCFVVSCISVSVPSIVTSVRLSGFPAVLHSHQNVRGVNPICTSHVVLNCIWYVDLCDTSTDFHSTRNHRVAKSQFNTLLMQSTRCTFLSHATIHIQLMHTVETRLYTHLDVYTSI